MSIGAFVDNEHQPTIDAMIASVRSKRRLWEGLTQFIDVGVDHARESPPR